MITIFGRTFESPIRGSWLSSSQRFVGNAFLLGTVQVVERAAERHEHPEEAAFGELIVVARPTLVQIEDVGCGEILKRSGVRDLRLRSGNRAFLSRRNRRIGRVRNALLGDRRLRSGTESGRRRRFSFARRQDRREADCQCPRGVDRLRALARTGSSAH
jgi:hypothetical protein